MDKALTIRADATYEAYPEVSHLIVGIQSSRPLAVDACSEGRSKLDAVIDELRQHGYTEEDITVIDQRLAGASWRPSGEEHGSSFKTFFSVAARSSEFPRERVETTMAHFAAITDAVSRRGVELWGTPAFSEFGMGSPFVLFSFADPVGTEAALLEKAIRNAEAKAAQVAERAGKRIAELTNIEATYTDFGIRGREGLTGRFPGLAIGGALQAIEGPLFTGYGTAVLRLTISATFMWS
jgi:hypothetical protein